MQIKPIRTPAAHQAALQEIETLMDAEWGSPEGARLDVLTTLVQFWEQQHFSNGANDDNSPACIK